MLGYTLLLVIAVALGFFLVAQNRAVRVADGRLADLHSRPSYHGLYSLLWALIAGVGVLALIGIGGSWLVTSTLLGRIAAELPEALRIEHQLVLSDAQAIARGGIPSAVDALREAIAEDFARLDAIRRWGAMLAALVAALAAGTLTLSQVATPFRARNRSERIVRSLLLAAAVIAVLTTIGIVLSLIFETLVFFDNIGWRLDKFLFGTRWSPLSGVMEGRMDPERVGAIPLFAGTFMITIIAMLVAVPVGLFAAIYLSDFASARVRAVAKPMLEVLAGVPTVVYGFFAAITVAPFVRGQSTWIIPLLLVALSFFLVSVGLILLDRIVPGSGRRLRGAFNGLGAIVLYVVGAALMLLYTYSVNPTFSFNVASESALAAGIVMGIMIIPFISSLSDDVINAVPQSLRDGSYGLGATRAETIRQVILPAALPGIVSAVLLGVSRAVGETMIVVMAAGQGANLTWNPMEAVTTVTVQIVMLITGDTEATVAAGPAFTLGFTLFIVTLLLNILALRIVRRYRELYD
ncbi:MAG: PstC family ABC transporter permease [Pseudomonadota bacterium]